MTGKKTGKRLLTWVLTLMMVLTLLPLNVLAEYVPLDEPTDEEDSLDNDNVSNDGNIQNAEFYYLMSPTSDPDSNSQVQWGKCLGDGKIDINGLYFEYATVNADNAFNIQSENIKQWPDEESTAGLSFTLDKDNKDQFVDNWDEIFENYKKSIQTKYGVDIAEDDITSITFTPHKISDNLRASNLTKCRYHVDCTVEINCENFVTAKFFFVNAEGKPVQLASNYYKNGEFISEEDINNAEAAANGKVPNGCKLIKWYSDLACTEPANPSDRLSGNVNFYCKAVQMVTYTVNYRWGGESIPGTTSDQKTVQYGAEVTVFPIKIDGYTPVKESETITIDDDNKVINLNYYKNVELTAKSDTRVYNGVEQTLEGYTCDTEGVTFEGITASGSGTDAREYPVTFNGNLVNKHATVDNKDYIITKATEGTLNITPVTEEVTVTIKGNTKTVYYNGKEQSVEGYTVESISNPLYTESDFSLKSGITAEAKGKKVGTYDMGLTNESFKNTSKNFTNVVFIVEDGYLKIKRHAVAPSRPTEPEVEEEPFKLNTDDHFAYIIGYPDGTVQPNGQITRAEATTIFFRLLTDESREANLTKTNRYTDVAAGAWYNTAISTMTRAGIVDGYPDGTFRPDAPITRAEMSKIISLFAELDKKTDRFSDIAGHWAEKYIKLAAGNGWIEGYPDGTFLPQRNITRAETATMINRVLERVPSQESRLLDRGVMQTWPDANPGDWFYLAIQEATNSHDYERSEKWNAADEQWTALRANRDWKALEQ